MVKQILIISILGFICTAVAAAPWSVPDPNLQECLTELAQQNGWAEPAAFQSIKCHNRRIESVAGLDAFSHITSLSLFNNQLRQVQLRGFAQLQHLNLSRNDLRELKLEDLPSLQKLYFFDNRIAHMTLAGLPRLAECKGNNNALETFSYAELPELKKLYLFNNQLKTIDIYRLPSLQYMDVRENPMPDKLYEEMDAMQGITFLHDGNAEDW